MEPLVFEADRLLLLFFGGAVDVFHTSYGHPFRQPAAWVAARPKFGRRGGLTVDVGRTEGNVVYGQDLKLSWTDLTFDLDPAQEPALRAFFEQVAQASGRAMA